MGRGFPSGARSAPRLPLWEGKSTPRPLRATMRAPLVSAGLAVAALLAPLAGASCHWCVATNPVQELLHHFLP